MSDSIEVPEGCTVHLFYCVVIVLFGHSCPFLVHLSLEVSITIVFLFSCVASQYCVGSSEDYCVSIYCQ